MVEELKKKIEEQKMYIKNLEQALDFQKKKVAELETKLSRVNFRLIEDEWNGGLRGVS